ncbi:unnamed protein product [Prunus armeniaca]
MKKLPLKTAHSVDHEADLKHSRENLLVSYILIAYFIHWDSLMHEEEQLHDDKKTGSDALQQAGEVLGQSAQSAMDVEVLCMDHLRKSSDTRDSSSEAATLCKPGKTHALIRDEAQVLSSADPKATETPHLGRSLPYLDLSVIPTEVGDSCKDDDKVSPLFSKEITPKNQCMQLFSEEKTGDIFRPVTTQPVAAASIASGQRRNSSVGRQK